MSTGSIIVDDSFWSTTITVVGEGFRKSESVSAFDLLGIRDPDLLHRKFPDRLAKLDDLFKLGRRIEQIAVAADDACLFKICGERLADELAWEALPARFDNPVNEGRYIPVRVSSATPAWKPELFTERLRFVTVVGHPGSGQTFSVQTVINLVKDILGNITVAERECIEAPDDPMIIDISDGDQESWAASMAEIRPHMVLYFGHGESDPEPCVQITSDDWLPLDELCDAMFKLNGVAPQFWVFVACSLGGGTSESGAGVYGPKAFEIVSRRGAVSMLAMRAEVRISIAQTFLSEFLRLFISGAAPELAAAGARRVARFSKQGGVGNGPWDWAAPAVWSVAEPMQTVSWGPEGGRLAKTGETALRLLRGTAKDPSLGAAPPSLSAVERAKWWWSEKRIRIDITGDPGPGFIARCCAILDAARRDFVACPLLIEPGYGGESFSGRLKGWAMELRRGLLPSLDDPVLAAAVHRAASGDKEGLQNLLAIPKAFVIILGSPGPTDVAWDIIAAAPPDSIVAICQPRGAQGLPSDHWVRDPFEEELDPPEEVLDSALITNPGTMAVLAALRRPMKSADLKCLTEEDQSSLPGAPIIRSEPASGIVIADRYRKLIQDRLGPTAMAAAHERIATYLPQVGRLSFDWDELVLLEHLAGAERWADFASAVNQYVYVTPRGSVDWIAISRILSKAVPAHDAIHPEVFIDIGQAYVDLQDLQSARFWLERRQPSRRIDEARQQALLSEVWKGDRMQGASEEMWRCAESAVALCRAELAKHPGSEHVRRDLRHHELQIARLELYFRHSAVAARTTFEGLIAAWEAEDDGDAVPPIVAAKRNLAECLFEFRPFKEKSEARRTAENHLLEAMQLCKRFGLRHAACDIGYSQAKLAEVEGCFQSALDHLATCTATALEIGYPVLHRIAQARSFWTSVRKLDLPFDKSTFLATQRALEFLDWHLWAVRYAMVTRLWAARRYAATGDIAGAVALLSHNCDIYLSRPALSGGSDRVSFLRSCAGLTEIDQQGLGAQAWARIPQHDQYGADAEKGSAAIWAEVD